VVYTVGHSTHPLEDFVALVGGAGVRAIADVRRYPASRRNPQFAALALEETLPAQGITYAHLEALGGRREPVPRSPNRGWENEGFRGYADHMATPEFAAGLTGLESLAAALPTAIMCAEGDWHRCHRRLLADALVVRGWGVVHIAPDGELSDHRLTDFAVVERGTITYPPNQGELLDV
jgi:uncharacterized protein (DUF488 family)